MTKNKNKIKYENIDKFCKRVKRCRRTIFRFYKKYPELKEETQLKNERLIPVAHQKYWKTELLFDENKSLQLRNKVLQDDNRMFINTLDALQNSNELSRKLWFLPWTHVITICPRKNRDLAYCTDKIMQFYNLIDIKYGAKTKLRIFYNSEKFADRNNSYHSHIVLNIENEKYHSLVIELLKQDFKFDKIETAKYDYHKGFLFYAVKNQKDLNTISWGIDGNNLKKESLTYENKSYQKAV